MSSQHSEFESEGRDDEGKRHDVLSQREAAEVNALFDLALDLFCVFGFDGVFRRVNPAFERTLGFTSAELTSRPFIEFVHPEDRPATLAVEKLAYNTGEIVFGFENRFATSSGAWRYISWAARPVMAERIVYSVGRDVTELKKAQEDLRQAKEHLELQVRERTRELSAANKDLKSEISERKKTLRDLVNSQKRLADQSAHLQEVNNRPSGFAEKTRGGPG